MRTMEPEERFERIERQLEFLAANQAQHDARMAEISRKQEENSRQIGVNSAHIGQLADLTLRIGRIVEEQAHRMYELAESQRRADERLSALIKVVERYFSDGHK
ncbi:MAG: hypothetical protein HXY20_11570 [Acidobacteria bacterium]|nr:hypothetical protein [Acidobacteriota bacterium]